VTVDGILNPLLLLFISLLTLQNLLLLVLPGISQAYHLLNHEWHCHPTIPSIAVFTRVPMSAEGEAELLAPKASSATWRGGKVVLRYPYICVCIYIYVYIDIYVYICGCVNDYLCVYIYIVPVVATIVRVTIFIHDINWCRYADEHPLASYV
jgi:hypothetical protein